MNEPVFENGMAHVGAGRWLVSPLQPAAFAGTVQIRGMKGFIVPDRGALRVLETTDAAWCAAADRPFLTHLAVLPDAPLEAVSKKVLVAPADARTKGYPLKLVPMSFMRAAPVTRFEKDWAVMATRSRVTRVTVEEEKTFSVAPEALVAWIGKRPTGFCPKLRFIDILRPRGPQGLVYTFHGPATVWFEGVEPPAQALKRRCV